MGAHSNEWKYSSAAKYLWVEWCLSKIIDLGSVSKGYTNII